MAKKLPPEELKRMKADFDPPVDPNQTELFGTQKVNKKKTTPPQKKKTETKKAAAPDTKHAGGRPRKSDEETRVYSFRLPERTVRRLRVRAALDGVSAADVIIDLADKMKVPGIDK